MISIFCVCGRGRRDCTLFRVGSVAMLCLTLCDPTDCIPPGSSAGFPRQEYWSGLPGPAPGDLPNSGIESRSPTLRVDSLHSEPPGKPNNTGVGSLSLLQGIFLTQESNRGLLHCRQILHKLSCQGSPWLCIGDPNRIGHLNNMGHPK